MKSLVLFLILSLASAFPTMSPSSVIKKQAVDCPLYLPAKGYEFPHLIVPISGANPNAAIGNAYTPAISPKDLATIFNFDIPASRSGQTCSLYFSLPTQSQLVTTKFTYSGPGTFEFLQYQYGSRATFGTTWNTQPPLSGLPPVFITHVTPGFSYKIWTGDCGVGGAMSWRMSSDDSCLWFFQDFNECAIGVYVVYD